MNTASKIIILMSGVLLSTSITALSFKELNAKYIKSAQATQTFTPRRVVKPGTSRRPIIPPPGP